MPLTVQLEDEKVYEAHLLRVYENSTNRQLKEANIEITSFRADIPLGFMGQCYTVPLLLDSELIEHSMWSPESDATDEADGSIWTSCYLRDADDLVRVLLPTLRHLGLIDITLRSRLTGGTVAEINDDAKLLEWCNWQKHGDTKSNVSRTGE